MSRPLVAQVNLSALRANLAKARECAAHAQLLAVVKADAYGHGIKRILPALAKADGLALLELDGAVALRERHYARRILLLEGFFSDNELPEIAARRLAVVVHHVQQIEMLEAATLPRPIEVFVKVNTGMNRLGFRPGEVHAIVDRLSQTASVAVLRLLTHLARAEEEDGLREQLRDRSRTRRASSVTATSAAITSVPVSCCMAPRRFPTIPPRCSVSRR